MVNDLYRLTPYLQGLGIDVTPSHTGACALWVYASIQ
jgi:hypothetical protein